MTDRIQKSILNAKKLKENNLSFIFDSENEGEFDLRIQTLSGQLIVTDLKFHIDPIDWLDEHIDEAIYKAGILGQTSGHNVDAVECLIKRHGDEFAGWEKAWMTKFDQKKPVPFSRFLLHEKKIKQLKPYISDFLFFLKAIEPEELVYRLEDGLVDSFLASIPNMKALDDALDFPDVQGSEPS